MATVLNEDEDRRCGRPTKSGKPCRQLLNTWEWACRVHATDEDRAIATWANEIWNRAFRSGFQSGKDTARQEAEFERRAEAERARIERDWRLRDDDGRQLVQIEHYTYAWDGTPPLNVGDTVLLPGVFWIPGRERPWQAVVTELGSSYRDELSVILALIEPGGSREAGDELPGERCPECLQRSDHAPGCSRAPGYE